MVVYLITVTDTYSMLGERILVAPVFHDSVAQFYLPEGRWTWYVEYNLMGCIVVANATLSKFLVR